MVFAEHCVQVIMEIVQVHDSLSPSSSLGSSVAKPMTMRPESPSHGGFDLYGKRRLVLKVHALEREIGLLEVRFIYLYFSCSSLMICTNMLRGVA